MQLQFCLSQPTFNLFQSLILAIMLHLSRGAPAAKGKWWWVCSYDYRLYDLQIPGKSAPTQCRSPMGVMKPSMDGCKYQAFNTGEVDSRAPPGYKGSKITKCRYSCPAGLIPTCGPIYISMDKSTGKPVPNPQNTLISTFHAPNDGKWPTFD